MKRHVLYIILTFVLMSALLFSACVREEIDEGGKLDPDEQSLMETEDPNENMQWDPTTLLSSDADGTQIAAAWNTLAEARDKMSNLTDIEENQLLYTKKQGSEESITLRLTMTRIGGDDFAIGAKGTVKTQGNVIPLEIYYKNGVMVRISGGNKVKEESSMESVLATVDFLQSIRRDLQQENITYAEMLETADGIKTISVQFEGTISGLATVGRGEILIDSDGLISSEGYSFEAINKDGEQVSQSVECTLLACNKDVKAIDLPEELR